MISLHDPFWMVYFGILAVVLGSVFGSFLNCMAWRIPKKERIFGGGDRCMHCGHRLKAIDLIPIVSYLIQGGRCRYCKKKITPKYLFTEIFLAAMFVWTTFSCGLTLLTVRNLIVISVLFYLSLVDLNFYYIPDMCHVIMIVLYFVTAPFVLSNPGKEILMGMVGAVLTAGGMYLLSLVMDRILGKESLGGGDIKLFFVSGLYLGSFKSLFGIIFACVFGLILGAVSKKHPWNADEKMTEKDTEEKKEEDPELKFSTEEKIREELFKDTDFEDKKEKIRNLGEHEPGQIPFGPAISFAMAIMLLIGNQIVNGYMSLF